MTSKFFVSSFFSAAPEEYSSHAIAKALPDLAEQSKKQPCALIQAAPPPPVGPQPVAGNVDGMKQTSLIVLPTGSLPSSLKRPIPILTSKSDPQTAPLLANPPAKLVLLSGIEGQPLSAQMVTFLKTIQGAPNLANLAGKQVKIRGEQVTGGNVKVVRVVKSGTLTSAASHLGAPGTTLASSCKEDILAKLVQNKSNGSGGESNGKLKVVLVTQPAATKNPVNNTKKEVRTKRFNPYQFQPYKFRTREQVLRIISKYEHVKRLRELGKMASEATKCDRKSIEMFLLLLKILEFVDNGTIKTAGDDIKNFLSPVLISRALLARDNIELAASDDPIYNSFRKSNNYPIEVELLKYFVTCKEKGIDVSKNTLRSQASIIADALQMPEFVGTDYWLINLLQRNLIYQHEEGNLWCNRQDLEFIIDKLKTIENKKKNNEEGRESISKHKQKRKVEKSTKKTAKVKESSKSGENLLTGSRTIIDACEEPPAPDEENFDAAEIQEVPPKKKRKKEMPKSCRICSADLFEAGGLRLRDFNIKKAKAWIREFVGYEVVPVEKTDGSEFPFGICWNCVHHFKNWIKQFGKPSLEYWSEAEWAVWNAYQCTVETSTQTECELEEVSCINIDISTPDQSKPDNVKEENLEFENASEPADCILPDETEMECDPLFDPLNFKPEHDDELEHKDFTEDHFSTTVMPPALLIKTSPKPLKFGSPNQGTQVDEDGLLCPLCNKMFRDWRQLLGHNRKCQIKEFQLKADLVRCKICKFASFNEEDVKSHSCTSDKSFSIEHACTLCKVGFSSSSVFWKHVCL
ncbi:uncharacterized protein LOC132197672 isoform X3 [Neocloeon triangulifer]|uniref:uncharacterized protein LOC132197672 isoform X3 n=1 Tax=Neocloeon triangulifer TaxID=2078957 RepID=UPI00286F4F35|nr:uncharacterized protein LOC132197672 isoform X3 [Neocloeon triangulifer]XP_059477161.1 uncharacterized protein LOC132197672 isoform X3 [Neocloeon triangulifer]XP_059477171.1 uncharacterized protein LOC132197672 isoform X3 [Neocloeon triangulifer]